MTQPRPSTARNAGTVREWLAKCRAVFTDSGPERNAVLLILKAALATVLAWQFAVRILDSPTPFYAPMAALLVVDRTVVRSLWTGAQRIAAVVLGMGVAWLVGSLVGVHWWSVGPVLVVALVIARWSRLGDHGIQVPVMVLMSLLTVGGTDVEFTYLTIVETIAGGAIGVLINLLVLAPLHVTRPREQVATLTTEVAGLLDELAKGLRTSWTAEIATGWYRRGIEITDGAPVVADELATGRESIRFNPRNRIRRVDVDWDGYRQSVETLRTLQWRVAGIARTLADAADERSRTPAPEPEFLRRYCQVLESLATTVRALGRRDERARREFAGQLERAESILTDLQLLDRRRPVDDARIWTSHGTLISDAQRCCRVLEMDGDRVTVPTDSRPIRMPLLDGLAGPKPASGSPEVDSVGAQARDADDTDGDPGPTRR